MMNPYNINPAARRFAEVPKDEEEPNLPGKTGQDNQDPKNAAPAPDKNPPDQELIKEISWSEQDVLQSYLPFANNPDPIVRSKGLKIYREMMQDDQVKVCVDVRIQARLSTPWEIVPGLPGNVLSEKMAKFIKTCLTRMRGNFETDMEQMYSAIGYGFSISEKVFDYIEKGEFKGMIGLRAIKTREPFNYDFKIDPHGNLLGLTYIGITGKENNDLGAPGAFGTMAYGNMSPLGTILPTRGNLAAGVKAPFGSIENPFPPEKFIVYSYNPQFGNWYGRSDFLGAFKWWLMKKHGSKFWAIWLERYASPFVWAQYKRDAGLKKESLLAIDDFIRNLSARQGVRVSDAVDINSIQFTPSAGDAYEKAIEAYNRYIAHAILFPNLLGFTGGQGSSGGSYSLGQKQFDSFLWILNKMGRDMSETIVGDQIIKQLIQINFGDEVDQELYPKFRFISIDDAAIEVRSKIVDTLCRAGIVAKEEEWVRDFLTLPKLKPGIVLPDAQPQGGIDPNNPEGKPGEQKPAGAQKKDDEPEPKKTESEPKKDETKMAEFKEREPDYFEQKMKVKQFKSDLEKLDQGLLEEATAAMESIREELLDKVTRKNLVTEGDISAVAKLTVNVKGLKDTFAKWMVKIYLDSKLSQLEEMGRAGLNVEITKRFAAVSQEWEPLPPQEAVDYFRRKVTAKIVDDAGKKILIDLATGFDISFFQNRAFTIAGIVRDDVMNDAKQILLNGIKRQDQAGAVKSLKDMFNKYLDQGIEIDEELLSPHRLNTIVRTNITEAINEGRAAMMTDPDVGDFVQFFQYTAIMDERTTDYCRCMDGKIFRIEDLDQIKPPAHFNCRSFTVPITQFEIQDLKKDGRGVEVSSPCSDRMSGFSDLKRDPIQIKNQDDPSKPPEVQKKKEEPVIDLAPAPKTTADQEATERLKKDLSQLIVRCPYNFCNSDKITFNSRMMNIGNYECEACRLPFRVSSKGDLYLYDAGIDKWERTTIGSLPAYFAEKENKK